MEGSGRLGGDGGEEISEVLYGEDRLLISWGFRSFGICGKGIFSSGDGVGSGVGSPRPAL